MTDPVMTAVRRNTYPATLRLPGGREIQRARVVLVQGGERAGIWAWQGSPDRLAYRADIDWAATILPVDERTAADIHLTDGTTVQFRKGGACPTCGTFARWPGPDWAHAVQVQV